MVGAEWVRYLLKRNYTVDSRFGDSTPLLGHCHLLCWGGHRAKPERNEIIQQLKSPSHEATKIPKANNSSIVVSREYKASYLGQVNNKRFMWSYPPQGQFNSIFDVFLSSKCNTDKPTKVIFGSKFNV